MGHPPVILSRMKRNMWATRHGQDKFNQATNNNDVFRVCMHGSCYNATANVKSPSK
jgi:hypothetical protein